MYAEKSFLAAHDGGQHRIVYSAFEGDPSRTVLCVHGLSRNGRDFDVLAQALTRRGHRVLCPDMPGRGRSDDLANPAHYNYGQYFADLTALLAHEGVTQTDWVGTSMGGLLGMMFAANMPHLIHRLVINDIGPFIPAAAIQTIKTYVADNSDFPEWAQFMAHFKATRASFGLTTEAEWDYFARISARMNEDGSYRLAYDTRIAEALSTVQDVDLWPVWDKIAAPMLILRGAESEVLSADTFTRMLVGKNARGATFAGCGHAPTLLATDQVETIVEFLDIV